MGISVFISVFFFRLFAGYALTITFQCRLLILASCTFAIGRGAFKTVYRNLSAKTMTSIGVIFPITEKFIQGFCILQSNHVRNQRVAYRYT